MVGKIDLDKIPLNDEKTIRFLQKGENMYEVFQVDANITRRYFNQVFLPIVNDLDKGIPVSEVRVISAISDVETIIRPSARNSGASERYIKKALGEKVDFPLDNNYFLPMFKKNTKETYFELIYQEQLMFFLNDLFEINNLGLADIYRRYFEGNKTEDINLLKQKFWDMYKTKATLLDCKNFWNFLLLIAGYNFNKSHAVGYAVITYKTAYLKTHITKFYICACIPYLTDDAKTKKLEKIEHLTIDANKLGITVLPPRINNTFEITFPDMKKDIIYLSPDIIKGVGKVATKALAKRNDFKDLKDFFNYVKKNTSINKKVVELALKIGYFEPFEKDKKKVLDMINNYKISTTRFEQKKFIKKYNDFVYKLKDNNKFKETLIADYGETCKIRTETSLFDDKIDINEWKSSYTYEYELLTFILSNVFEGYEGGFLEESDKYFSGYGYIMVKTSHNRTKYYNDKPPFYYRTITCKSNDSMIPESIYMPRVEDDFNYKYGDILCCYYSIRNKDSKFFVNKFEYEKNIFQ